MVVKSSNFGGNFSVVNVLKVGSIFSIDEEEGVEVKEFVEIEEGVVVVVVVVVGVDNEEVITSSETKAVDEEEEAKMSGS